MDKLGDVVVKTKGEWYYEDWLEKKAI
jgi:hypothetical protein